MRQLNLAPHPPTNLGFKATVGAIFGSAVAYGLGYDNANCLIASSLAAICVRIALIDLKQRIILDHDLIAMTTIGVTWLIWTQEDIISALGSATFRAIIYSLILFLLQILFLKLRNRNGIGKGDIKLIASSGIFIKVESFYIMILCSCAMACLFLIYRRCHKSRKCSRFTYLPFGTMVSISMPMVWIFSINLNA